MRTFNLVRRVDVSGVSGTGRVCEGVVFHDGQTVLSWFGQHHSVAVYPNIEDVIAIHGHDGCTTIEWTDENGNEYCSNPHVA